MSIPNYVVRISGETTDGATFNGTGFLVNPQGYVATCYHVIAPGHQKAKKIFINVPGHVEPWVYQLREKSEDDDVALLESVVPPTYETPYATLHADWHSEAVIGQELTICGHSSASNYPAGQEYPCKISGFSEKDGRVGVIGSINPGDSGGPVIDAKGIVIGIIHARDRVRDGQSRFIPVSLLINLLRESGIPFKEDHHSQPSYFHNPFNLRSGITEAKSFFGRTSEQRMLRSLLQGRQNCQVVGPRRIGKTSLLLQIERLAQTWQEATLFAYLDLMDVRSSDLSGWLDLVSEQFNWAKSSANLKEFTNNVVDMVAKKLRPVLCLDEFEELASRRDEFNRTFFANLRSCGQKGMSIITASQKPLSRLTERGDPTSPFYNTFPILRLGPFSESEAEDFVNIHRAGVPPFEPEEKRMILEFAKGQPLALQIACFYVVEAKQSDVSVNLAMQKAADEVAELFPPS